MSKRVSSEHSVNSPGGNPAPAVVVLDGSPLRIEDVVAVARERCAVSIAPTAIEAMSAARQVIDKTLAAGSPVYGVNTGFGSLSRKRIGSDQLCDLQQNLVRSHAVGVDEPLDTELVRGMQLLLAASLSRGRSGIRPVVVERLVALLNANVVPVIPSRGSVGASGDLAPLAHAALVLIGEGYAVYDGQKMTGGEALEAAGIEPVQLQAKEGLALLNGTHLMGAMLTLAVADLDLTFDAAVSACAMSIDACRATDAFCDPRLHEARAQVGQQKVASELVRQLAGSTILTSHKTEDDPRVQDPYSLRCAPQVLGAVSDMIEYARAIALRELSGVTDNPLIFTGSHSDANGRDWSNPIVSGGNFHGLPLALAMDALGIAVAHLAGIAERRVFFLLAATDPQNPVNPYLSSEPGLHSGLMIAQYTAAATCNEIQTLAAPASVHNIPTSAGQEDYNSFGPTAGFQLRRAIRLAMQVVAIEFMCAAEGLEYQRPEQSGDVVEYVYRHIRRQVPRLERDRALSDDIAAVVGMIKRGGFGV
ncbi:MAG: histidine ammonia-lyase [Planctomycetes bacterium]|nr:histidine ammonia-lyase [Planctomycetota bacterium]NOG55646.1 histidine ammonia-lyase [Planctomycetota bacterium]